MRIVIGIVALLVALGAGARAEAACKRKGKVLFVETVEPLPDAAVSTAHVGRMTITIWESGAFTVDDWKPDDVAPTTTKGCLIKAHLKAIKRALGKAKFKIVEGTTCRALSTARVVYSSPKRKKEVETAAPCGAPVDDWTAALVSCGELVGSPLGYTADATDVRAMCRP